MLEIMSHQYKKPDFNPYNEFTPLQFFNFYDKYSRFDWNTGKRETWDEAIGRTTNLLRYLSNNQLTNEEYQVIYEKLYKMEIQPSMRLMATSLEQLKRDNISQYNCCYIVIDSIESMVESLYIGMSGVGMGYSVEKKFINQLPIVLPKTNNILDTYIVPDTTEGWCNSVRILLTALYNGDDINFDYSKVRPAGMPLKIKGGYSSGSQILQDVHMRIKKIFSQAYGRKFIPIEVHDLITTLADAGLSGGIRRCLPKDTLVQTKNGLIPIQNITVTDYVKTFSGYNKVVNTFIQGVQQTIKIKTQINEFECTPNHRMAVLNDLGKYDWKEAKDLQKNDRLIFNYNGVDGKETYLPEYNYVKPEKSTTVKNINIPELTTDIAYLFGQIHGDGYVWKQGRKGRITIAMSDNYPEMIDKVVSSFKLFGLMPIIKQGEGNYKKVIVHSYQLADYMQQWKLPNSEIIVPDFILQGTREIRSAYLAGLLDSDGCVKNRPIVVLNSVYSLFSKTVQNLYFSLGIPVRVSEHIRENVNWKNINKISLIGKLACEKFMETVNNYLIKDASLFITTKRDIFTQKLEYDYQFNIYDRSIEVIADKYNYDLNYLPIKVLDILEGSKIETYDIEVEDSHEFYANGLLTHNSALLCLFDEDEEDMLRCKSGNYYITNPNRMNSNNSIVLSDRYYSQEEIDELLNEMWESGTGEPGLYNRGNVLRTIPSRRKLSEYDKNTIGTNACAEIMLRNHGVCNLSSAIIRKDDTIDIMLDKIKWATIVGDIQSMGTNFPNLRKSWENTAKEDRLLGVNILGYAENKLLQDESVLELLKNAAIQTDLDFAKRFNLKQSVAITSAKPSGNTSVLYNTTPGINPYHFQYCYRNVTVQIGTTMYNYLYANGVPFQEYLGKPGAVMFKFPFKAPDNADVIANTPAIQQLENWKKVKLNYTEHNPSITITYRPEEIEDCKKWLHNNQNIICGISLFPAYDASHPMLPIQEITKDEYDNAIANFPDLNWENFCMYEQYFDQRNIALECAGGRCDI